MMQITDKGLPHKGTTGDIMGQSHTNTAGTLRNAKAFVNYTKWQNPVSLIHMQQALDFFHSTVPPGELYRPTARPTFGTPGGDYLILTQFMQAIDFSHAVERRFAGMNDRFKRFGKPVAKPPRKPGRDNNYFTYLSQKQDFAGLHADQHRGGVYRVTKPFEYLKTTVADAYSWWVAAPGKEERGMQKDEAGQIVGRDFSQHFWRGGGNQCFIWNPHERLELV